MDVVIAAGAFVGLFAAFVVVPTIIQKRHEARRSDSGSPTELPPAHQ